MFKKILIAALMVASFSFAQLNFGAHAALNMSNFWGDDVNEPEMGVGFSAGLGMKLSFPLLPITLAPEVLIDMRNVDAGGDLTITEWALDIPVLVRLSLLPILYLEAGPVVALNLSSTAEADGVEVDLDKLGIETNTLELGVAFGIGTGIVPFVDIDFRVNLGLTSWAGVDSGLNSTEDMDMQTLQFALGATYWF